MRYRTRMPQLAPGEAPRYDLYDTENDRYIGYYTCLNGSYLTFGLTSRGTAMPTKTLGDFKTSKEAIARLLKHDDWLREEERINARLDLWDSVCNVAGYTMVTFFGLTVVASVFILMDLAFLHSGEEFLSSATKAPVLAAFVIGSVLSLLVSLFIDSHCHYLEHDKMKRMI